MLLFALILLSSKPIDSSNPDELLLDLQNEALRKNILESIETLKKKQNTAHQIILNTKGGTDRDSQLYSEIVEMIPKVTEVNEYNSREIERQLSINSNIRKRLERMSPTIREMLSDYLKETNLMMECLDDHLNKMKVYERSLGQTSECSKKAKKKMKEKLAKCNPVPIDESFLSNTFVKTLRMNKNNDRGPDSKTRNNKKMRGKKRKS